MKNIKISPTKISTYDAIVIATDHSDFDYEMILKNAKIIIDTRNVFAKHFKNLIKA